MVEQRALERCGGGVAGELAPAAAERAGRMAVHFARVAAELAGAMDRQTLVERIVRRAREIFEATVVGLDLWDGERGGYVIHTVRETGQLEVDHVIPAGAGLNGRIVERGEPVIVADYAEFDGRLPHLDGVAVGPSMGAPVRVLGEIAGSLIVQAPPSAPPYTAADAELLQYLADLTSVAIEHARFRQVAEAELEERRRAQAERRESEARFARVFHASPAGICLTTLADGRVVDINDSFLAMIECSRAEVLGRRTTELALWPSPADRTAMVELLREHGAVRGIEAEFRTRTGDARPALTSREVVEIGGEPCVLTIAYDLTERKRLEAQLQQAQKMEAVGQLAGGIAHDFNNMLGVILGFGELLLTQTEASDERYGAIVQIRDAAERAADLTRQLLAFSRKQVLAPRVLNLNEVIGGLTPLLARLIGEHIAIVTDLSPDLGTISADPTQLEQILLNLTVNARDAMPNGGFFTIVTANVEVGPAPRLLASAGAIPPGPYVLLSVSDNGTGMDVATQSRMFEPFFTTKAIGKGTGLGLSTVLGIVEQSGGRITVESEPGLGTTFRIYLPRLDAMPTLADLGTGAVAGPAGQETVLLVEDEPTLRTMTRQMLEARGYTVLEADGGDSALALVATYPDPIHALLTDVVMPGMGGRELAEAIAPTCPGIRVLYVSGYTDDAVLQAGEPKPGVGFLQKPFRSAVLAERLREVLDAPLPAG